MVSSQINLITIQSQILRCLKFIILTSYYFYIIFFSSFNLNDNYVEWNELFAFIQRFKELFFLIFTVFNRFQGTFTLIVEAWHDANQTNSRTSGKLFV